MIDKAILSQNLNSEVDLTEFFNAFGYGPEDSVFFRLFKDPKAEKKDPTTGNPVPGKNIEAKPAWFKKTVQTLRDYNQKNYGVFWVVNGGGNSDSEVKTSGTPARAQFAECDPSDEDLNRVETSEITMEDLLKDQLRRLSEFPLKPSIIIQTWKSLHCYWLLEGGDINRFRGIQKRLISLFHSDSTIQNESRVMRVPGFEHRKHDPVEVRLLRFEPDLRFTQDQVETALDLAGVPKEIPKKAAAVGTAAAPGEKILEGNGRRYHFTQETIGRVTGKLKDTVSAEAILDLVKKEVFLKCENAENIDDWEAVHLPFIQKCQQKALEEPQEDWSHNLRAWNREHPNEKFNPDVHGWKAVREAGERAREADKRFDEGLKAHKAELAQKAKENGSGAIKLMPMSDIEEEEVDWLIPRYIPAGQISLMAGDGGQGKTSVWCNLVAGISSGRRTLFSSDIPFPENEDVNDEPKTCLVFSSEDSVSKILRKRLRKAGADLTRVLCIDLADQNFESIKFNSPELAQIIAETRPALVVFDPLQSFIPPAVQMGARNQMRQCLSPLAALGEKYGTTFIIVMHTNKKQGVWGRTRCADSADIWDIARSVLIVGHTGEGEVHYLSHEKSNYGEQQSTILYEINDGQVEFKGTTTKRDREYVSEYAQAMRTSPVKAEAKEIIMNLLADGADHRVSEIDNAVMAAGISDHTMRRAKAELKNEARIKYRCEGYGKKKTFFVRRTDIEKPYEETA